MDKGKVGLLHLSLYGTTDAATNFQAEVRKFMLGERFVQSQYSPSLYWHQQRRIRVLVHGDDFVSVGSAASARWFRGALERRFEIKSTVVGTGPNEVREARILGRVIRVGTGGWQYEADQRHGELLAEHLNLTCAKSLSNPYEVFLPDQDGDDETLIASEATLFRVAATRANYLAQDRADIAFCR